MTQDAKDLTPIHVLAMLAINIVFWLLPAITPVTTVGMRLIGVFLSMLYGWTFCGLLWPSLFGMVAVILSGICSMKEWAALSFGNDTIVFILFIFFFTGVIDEVGLIDYIANKMISFKFLNGRPWLFSAFVLIGTYIAAAFVNMFAAILVFWGIIYIVADRFEFKRYESYPTLMIIGVILAVSLGGCVMPYKPVPIVVLKAYSQLAGVPMDFFKYIIFSLPVTFAITMFYILICRFVFRPDIKSLKNISVDFADPAALILNKKQKITIFLLIIFILLMIAPSILPSKWLVTQLINMLGNAGCLFILLIIMHWIKFDGEPLLSFTKINKHVPWDSYIVMAFVIPFAGLFTADATGIKPFIVTVMKPLLEGKPAIIFILLTLTLGTILTNIANNMVIGAVFTALIFTIGGSMGMAIAPVIAVLIVCANLALATPAASPIAAMMFANTSWCQSKDLYKYSALTVLISMFAAMALGLFWAGIIY